MCRYAIETQFVELMQEPALDIVMLLQERLMMKSNKAKKPPLPPAITVLSSEVCPVLQ